MTEQVNPLRRWYADLHVHIGRTENGDAVKISGSRDLTFYNIAKEASVRKGIDIVGIIDCHSPVVQQEIERYIEAGEMTPLPGGGIRYGSTTVLLGCEFEVKDAGLGPAHLLGYFPDLPAIRQFTAWIAKRMKNVNLSSQRIYSPARELQQLIVELGGLIIPAHIFTPYKSVYGSCSTRMSHLLDMNHIAAVELGLSADTEMAGYLSELAPFTFVTNSDAHSLSKIGREYNVLECAEPSFDEVAAVLNREQGRRVAANYGLNPRLGKYHRTHCLQCGTTLPERIAAGERCPLCGSLKQVPGVMDRILDLADRDEPLISEHRPPFHYQIPLEFVPGVGPKAMKAMLDRFGTEMNILHTASVKELAAAVGEQTAAYIVLAREGRLALTEGGGGAYGKVVRL